jgi:hypothetical protein
MKEKELEVGDEITSKPVAECDSCPEIILKVRFLNEKWRDLHTLMTRMGNMEYAAYLLGKIGEDGIPCVMDYYIPDQLVSTVEADITEVVIPEDIRDSRIGWIHSHHSMGAFHSGRDEDSMNYPLNVVISTTGYVATYRHATTCGRILRSKVEIVLVEPDRPIHGEEKIKEKRFEVVTKFPQFGGMDPANGWNEGWDDGYSKYERDQEKAYRFNANSVAREYARKMRKTRAQLLKVGME